MPNPNPDSHVLPTCTASITEPIRLLLPLTRQRDTLNARLARNGSNGMPAGTALSQLQSRMRQAALPSSVPLSAYCTHPSAPPSSLNKRPRLTAPPASQGSHGGPPLATDTIEEAVVAATQGEDWEGVASTGNVLAPPTQIALPRPVASLPVIHPALVEDETLINPSLPNSPSPKATSSSSSSSRSHSQSSLSKRPASPVLPTPLLPVTNHCILQPLATGIEPLDQALRGGLRTGTITELVGAGSSGKTQLALTTIVHQLMLPTNPHMHVALIVAGHGRSASARAVRRLAAMVRARLRPSSSSSSSGKSSPQSSPPDASNQTQRITASGVFRPQSSPPASGIFRLRRSPSNSQLACMPHDTTLVEEREEDASQDASLGTPARLTHAKRRAIEQVVASVLARVHVTTAPN